MRHSATRFAPATGLLAALITALPSHATTAGEQQRAAVSRESRVPAGAASLYAREIGQGRPVVVLHGGPDFDHRYLLPISIDGPTRST